MKKIAVVVALFASTQSALAVGAECRVVQDSRERLACYDAAFLPRKDKPVAVEADAPRSTYQDPFVAEDARTAAKLKNICRGC